MIEVTRFGTNFHLYDYTNITLNGYGSYLYHFKNNGRNNFIDDYHLMEAIVAAPSYDDAIKLVVDEYLGKSEQGYQFDVNLIALDLMSDEGTRVITHVDKNPLH